MEAKKQIKKHKPKKVTRPYLTGKPVDEHSAMSMIKIFLGVLAMMFAFLFLGATMIWENLFLRVLTNAVLILGCYLLFWQTGASSGSIAVNQGEILHQRRETGRSMTDRELSMSYHPLKGFINGLVGVAPLFICALLLAVMTQRQMTSPGALPSWLTTLERRDEIGGALAIYHQEAGMSVKDVLRLIVRMSIMPYVNLVGSTNKDGLLLLERFSPLLALIPGLVYGWGYTQGVAVRSQVHTDIAAGKRKQKRKEKKARQQRQAQRKGPEQLN